MTLPYKSNRFAHRDLLLQPRHQICIKGTFLDGKSLLCGSYVKQRFFFGLDHQAIEMQAS